MLGLGTNLIKGGGGVRNIVTDSLVLRHDYDGGAVQPLSDGAAYFVSGDIVGLGAKNGLGSSTTVTAWVWAKDVTSNGAIITFGDTMIRFDSSTSLKVFPDVSGGASTGTFNNIIGRWVHVGVTMTINGSNCDVLIYEDGALIRAETETSVPSTDSRESSIGSYVGGSFWSGYLCNVGLWNATLSQAQIKSIMNKNYAGLTSSEKTSLVSWWNLDSVITDTTTLVYDNHHGGGETLGSELVTNGTFTGVAEGTDVITLSGWSSYNSPASRNIESEKLKIVATGTNQGALLSVTTVSGKVYKLQYTATGDTGAAGIYINGIASVNTSTETTYYFTAIATTTPIYFRAATNTAGTTYYDNISVKLINGNTGTLS